MSFMQHLDLGFILFCMKLKNADRGFYFCLSGWDAMDFCCFFLWQVVKKVKYIFSLGYTMQYQDMASTCRILWISSVFSHEK
jgi:hypothetical protein